MTPEQVEGRSPEQESGPDRQKTNTHEQETSEADGLAIPDALKVLPHWVVWRTETRDGKPTKVPYNPSTGSRASSTDPTTWGTFSQAELAVSGYDGLGFVFTADDPFTGLDFDKCIKDGVLHPYVRTAIKKLDSYTEISPSGTGIHVIIKSKLKGDRNRTKDTPWGGVFEVYDHGRYFTVTGRALPEGSKW